MKVARFRPGIGRLARIAAVGLIAAPGVAVADPAPESVSGSGTVASTHFHVSISAGPYGEDPTGYLHVTGYLDFSATPTCLNQSGSSGSSGYRIDTGPHAGEGFLSAAGPSQAPGGFGATARAVSRGGSAAGVAPTTTAPDAAQILYSGILPSPPTACPPASAPPPPFLLSGGGGTISGTLARSGGPSNPLPLQQLRFAIPTPSAGPEGIAQEADGTMWFVESAANQLASMPDDESGRIAEYSVPTPAAGLDSIAPDRSGACSSTICSDPGMWFTESGADKIGHISPKGVIVEYPIPTANAHPSSISPDASRGGAWLTEPGANAVGYISESGHVSEYSLTTQGADPIAITADASGSGPNGQGAWFIEAGTNTVAHIDDGGRIVEHGVPTAGAGLSAVASDGGAGAWFLETTANKLGHIDSQGSITEYPIPTADSGAAGLAVGPGPAGEIAGAWFGEPSVNQIGYVDPSGQVSEFTLPGAQPDAIAATDTVAAPPLTGYTTSHAVWWTDTAASHIGLARFPIAGVPAVCSCGVMRPQPVAPQVRAADARYALRLLRHLRLGRSAKPLRREPRGDQGVLGRAGATLGALSLVDKHRWWHSDLRGATEYAYIKRHPPPGFRLYTYGPDYTRSSVHVGNVYLFLERSTVGLGRQVAMVVSVAPLLRGGTGIRVDAEITEGGIVN